MAAPPPPPAPDGNGGRAPPPRVLLAGGAPPPASAPPSLARPPRGSRLLLAVPGRRSPPPGVSTGRPPRRLAGPGVNRRASGGFSMAPGKESVDWPAPPSPGGKALPLLLRALIGQLRGGPSLAWTNGAAAPPRTSSAATTAPVRRLAPPLPCRHWLRPPAGPAPEGARARPSRVVPSDRGNPAQPPRGSRGWPRAGVTRGRVPLPAPPDTGTGPPRPGGPVLGVPAAPERVPSAVSPPHRDTFQLRCPHTLGSRCPHSPGPCPNPTRGPRALGHGHTVSP